jgi:signal transduction histidine kinase/CheY-like chemotaxis protein
MYINYFFDKLKKEDNLEKRFFIYACIAESILAFISVFLNIILGFDYRLAITCFISSIAYASLLYFYHKKYNFNKILFSYTILSIFLIDVFYFISGGLDSSIQSIFLMFLLTLSIILDKKYIPTILISFIFNVIFLYLVELKFNNLVIQYPDEFSKHIDLIFGVTVTGFFTSILIMIFKNTYTNALDNIKIQQNEISEIREKLNRERENVLKANHAKNDFLSVMTHEIRTPLNAIIGISNLIEENNISKDKQLIDALKDSSDNLLVLVSDILDFSKIQEGKIFLENIPFDLKKLIYSIEQIYSVKTKENNNKIILELDRSLKKRVLGDSVRLTQVINNLVSNAMKFTKNGTITIKVIKDNTFIDINDKSKIKVKFYIKDTGIGISIDKQEDIFEKFTQADSSITRKFGGTGLGLSITRSILELMGSQIKLESQENNGSTFYFDLILKEIEEENLISNKDVILDLSRIKLLLVEDNDLNIMVTTKFFDKWKISYEVAKNGFEAVEKANKSHFDIILMDLQMPEMDGFSATEKIREFNSKTPILALTANASLEIKERCIISGFNDYITKPFKPDLLKEKIFNFIQIEI